MSEVASLRPGTEDAHVSGTVNAMIKRGEIAREGFHKNYRYILTKKEAATGASAQPTS